MAASQDDGPRNGERDQLRASDADRQRVADVLRQHCAAGRLDVEEYADRAARAYAARSLPELLELTSDLPYPDAVVPTGGWKLEGRQSEGARHKALRAGVLARSIPFVPLNLLAPWRWAAVGLAVALAALVVGVYGPLAWVLWVFWIFLGLFVVASGAVLASRLGPRRK